MQTIGGYPEDLERLDRCTRCSVVHQEPVGFETECPPEEIQARDALQQAVRVVVPVRPHAHRHAVELFQPDGQRVGRIEERLALEVGPQRARVGEHSVRVGTEMPSRPEHHATGNLDDAVTARRHASEGAESARRSAATPRPEVGSARRPEVRARGSSLRQRAQAVRRA